MSWRGEVNKNDPKDDVLLCAVCMYGFLCNPHTTDPPQKKILVDIWLQFLRFPTPYCIGGKSPRPFTRGQSGGEKRATRVAPRRNTPVPPRRLTQFNCHHLIILINRFIVLYIQLVEFSAPWLSNKEKPTPQQKPSAASSKEATHNTTITPARHPLPVFRQNTMTVCQRTYCCKAVCFQHIVGGAFGARTG